MSGGRPQHCRVCDHALFGEPWQRVCWKCWRARRDADDRKSDYDRGFAAGLEAGRSGQLLDAELLAAAVQLCHPDRHPVERFPLANSVTAQLLELRSPVAA